MKRILITGKNSYVGNSVKDWLEKSPGKYSIYTISLRDESWKKHDFSKYDVIIHVAGIAHVSANPKMEQLYYKVNRDLTIETALKAKNDGVKQFIFMSSIIVYGDSSPEKKIINHDTVPSPTNFYGKSKLEAEQGIIPLNDKNFKIVIIRPPMIYGKGSKGNYQKLSKLAKISPIFPYVDNQRSMIHIDNLAEFIRLIIDNDESGIFHPQNKEYVNTSELVKLIGEANNKRIFLLKGFNKFINLMSRKVKVLNKVFGNLIYNQEISTYKVEYRIRNLPQSVKLTEKIDLK